MGNQNVYENIYNEIYCDLGGRSRQRSLNLWSGNTMYNTSSPPLIRTPLLPNTSALIRELSLGKREDRHS